MAMECRRCGYKDQKSTKCPQCGAPMRLTLLGDVEASPTQAARQSKMKGPPDLRQRLWQWFYCMVILHLFVYLLAIGTWFGARYFRLDPRAFPQNHPSGFALVATLGTLTAIVFALFFGARRIYLAQMLGLLVGTTGAAAILVERFFFGLLPAWYEWIALPIVGGIVGFVTGLKVTGPLEFGEEIVYEPVDTWDRKTKPKSYEPEPTFATRRTRLFAGILVAWFLPWPLGQALRLVLAAHRLNFFYVDLFGLFVGGVVAGSGTKSGMVQGFMTGLAFFGLMFVWDVLVGHRADSVQLMERLTSYLVVGVVGGLIGRRLLGPPRVYGSSGDLGA